MEKRSKQARVVKKRPSRKGVVRNPLGTTDLAYPGEVGHGARFSCKSIARRTNESPTARVRWFLTVVAAFALAASLAHATQLVGEVRVELQGNAATVHWKTDVPTGTRLKVSPN